MSCPSQYLPVFLSLGFALYRSADRSDHGGVSASFAMVGDIHIAEPGATIGFAGKRVIEETIREQLPKGFQTAEYLLEHGMVDLVVPRREIHGTLARILGILMRKANGSGKGARQAARDSGA